MKKLLFTIAVLFISGVIYAAAPQKHTTVNDDMQIFIKERQEDIVRFPSTYLKKDLRISVILPKSYKGGNSRYPAVYIFNKAVFDVANIDKLFYGPKSSNPEAVFISVSVQSGTDADAAALGKFITMELLPYFETNYRLQSTPESRILAASGAESFAILSILADKSDYVKNAAFILANTTAMPSKAFNLPADVSVWSAGNISNMSRLQSVLEASGLKYISSFAYKIIKPEVNKTYWQEINLKYLLDRASRAPLSADAMFGAKSVSASAPKPVEFFINLKTQGGYTINYIPGAIKMAPPFFMWDAASGTLNLIPGAEKGAVKLSGELPFGLGFDASLKITK